MCTAGMPGECMWIIVHHCDDEEQLLFGRLDTQPLNDYDGKVELGAELAVSYSQIREHRKPAEFTEQHARSSERRALGALRLLAGFLTQNRIWFIPLQVDVHPDIRVLLFTF